MKIFLILSILIFSLSGCSNNSTITNSQFEINRVSTEIPIEKEIEISRFSTNIYIKDPNRTKNISLTCNKINNIIVNSGETFSFCDIVGKSTPEKGYEKAEIFDSEGNVIEGYGGGNCQVSSTLYNALLELPGITILERHEHSNDVAYVPEGKDAAIAYGSIDFKFKNENSYPLKIYASNTNEQVNIIIVKLNS